MASAQQIKALLKSHLDGDDQRFFSVAMQVAAHEAKLGHGKLAEELRALIDAAKRRQAPAGSGEGTPTPNGRPRGELAGLLSMSWPKTRVGDTRGHEPARASPARTQGCEARYLVRSRERQLESHVSVRRIARRRSRLRGLPLMDEMRMHNPPTPWGGDS